MQIFGISWERALRTAAIATLFAAPFHAVAQETRPTSRPADELKAARSALATWLASDFTDAGILQAATEAFATSGRRALRELRRVANGAAQDRSKSRAIHALIRNITLAKLEAVRGGDVFYAGQYDELSELQPWAGDMLLSFVIQTPDWFPVNLRASVIPALRDLYPRGPEDDARDELWEIAQDEDHESFDLRYELACAFAQWGDRSMVEPHIAAYRDGAGLGQSIDELHFVRKLARLHYRLRDYSKAAGFWTKYLRGQERHEARANPLDYYNAACALSLAGRVEAALTELERCAHVLLADEFDDSQAIERSLFEKDPELRACRPSPRFAALVELAFGESQR